MSAGSAQVRQQAAASFGLAAGLLAGAMFVVVTTEFVVVGLLPSIARDLDLSLAAAGWLVSAFALSAGLLGPPLTMLAGRCEPRHVLVAAAMLFGIGNLLAALVPDYAMLIAVRLVQGCALPVFASVAIVAAARMAGRGREGWAASQVNLGVVGATVLGIPAGALIAEQAAWPASFAVLALLGFASAALLALRFPRLGTAARPSARAEYGLLRRPGFLAHLVLSGLIFTAMFAGYSYIVPLLAAHAGLDEARAGWMLMGFGVAGVFGNWIAGRLVDRDPLAAAGWVAGLLAFAMAAIGLAGGGMAVLVLLIGLWGAAHMAAFIACQAGAMEAGSEAPAFAMSLNISVCNLGIALGAVIGGSVIDTFGAGAAGYGAAGVAVLALLMAAAMMARRRV